VTEVCLRANTTNKAVPHFVGGRYAAVYM